MSIQSNVQPFTLERWQQTADFLLAVLTSPQSEEHYWKAIGGGMIADYLPPGIWRDTYLAVSTLIHSKQGIHNSTIRPLLNGSAEDPHIEQWARMYNPSLTGAIFEANLQNLLALGRQQELIAKAEALLKAAQSETDTKKVIRAAMSSLAHVGDEVVQGETASDGGAVFLKSMQAEPETTMMTGLSCVDSWIGGFSKGDVMAIVAPMKQRKTTLLLNIMIRMVRAGHSVGLLMLESHRDLVIAQIVSMLAVDYLFAHELEGKTTPDGIPVTKIQGKELLRIRKGYLKWDDLRKKAVDQAIIEYKSFGNRFRIYDKRRGSGSLSTLESVYQTAMRDKQIYKTDFLGIDHAQRIVVPNVSNEYERMVRVSNHIETLAKTENIAICLLAQLGASKSEGIGNTHASGVRGGTVLDEAVDYMLMSAYRQKVEQEAGRLRAGVMTIGLQHARYADGGPHRRVLVDIEPHSGWISNGMGRLLKDAAWQEMG